MKLCIVVTYCVHYMREFVPASRVTAASDPGNRCYPQVNPCANFTNDDFP